MQPSTALVLFPAAAATLFSFAALVLKRASQHGVDSWQTSFVVNMSGAVVYSFVWFLGGEPIDIRLWWQPVILAVCLFGGMTSQFLALNRGDVSVAVPVLGFKILIVAFLTPWLVDEVVHSRLWVSAVMSVCGVVCLNWRGGGTAGRSIATAILAGGVSAVFFSLFDILVQKWGPTWGAGRLLPSVFWINALFTLGCVRGFRTPLSSLPRPAWKWLLAGALLVNLQSILFVVCLATYGKAATANITFSARGLISVLLIWTVGRFFGVTESEVGSRVLFFRFIGAVFMLAAIVLAVT